MNILLVEDDPDTLETLRKGLALSFPTFTIATAHSAEDAEETVDGGFVPEIVITDVRLPGKSGVELLLDLERRLADVRFILTSGYDPPELAGQADDERVLRFLPKPFELAQLVAEVQGAYVRDQFSGTHRSITFIDILQMLNMARRTAVVEIVEGGRPIGEIYIAGGEVRHAECGPREGADAFHELCARPETSFRMRADVEPPRRTIALPFDVLLLAAMSDGDE